MISHSLSKRKKNPHAEKNRQLNSREPSRQSDNRMYGFPFHKPLLFYQRTIFVDLLSIKHSTKKSTYLPTFGYIYISFHEYDKLLKLFSLLRVVLNNTPFTFQTVLLMLSGDNFVDQYFFWLHQCSFISQCYIVLEIPR